ncbi:MAG: Hsp20/alpha crystallin family protein [Candidatus Cloacimonetes bacterium]|nr:Hsp20/alpha crystallin family protein [Candidatus Cloacimonadota bacterium]MDY0299342.1 Hsp20/alpha crystallin family protein [Candidatus Cloacimonadaceae bacterium]MCB5278784.1 Hsp20/alpha crystallin family protein [Candidatus Cloacimonadota bacterium]MCK9332318.1 Hsp20/alpha crystallin family protein [Candidatus Cloacimonadota bacterium]MDD2210891.1 Hsp20/alpha crystallin family protein [Candidatus Cloacimonadota bacterium]
MKLVPYRKMNEVRPMSNMLSLFDDFFNRVFEEEGSDENFRAMAMDITEHDKEFSIQANLPGFKKDNVKISVHDNQLLIEAMCEDNKEEQKGTVYRCERYSGSYRRNLMLPENANISAINAKMEDGVLTLTIPKKEPTPKQEIVIK